MGHKNIKEYYKIKHIVSVDENGDIAIGSQWITNIIVIHPDGSFVKKYDKDYFSTNEDLLRYQSEIGSDPKKFSDLFHTPDHFDNDITLYRFDEDVGEIVEDHCEKLGWPHTTHSGKLLYENVFFTDREKAVEKAILNLEAEIRWFNERIVDLDRELGAEKERLKKAQVDLKKLKEETS